MTKTDLVSPEQLDYVKAEVPLPPDILTSAKTGENVEALFQSIGNALLPQIS